MTKAPPVAPKHALFLYLLALYLRWRAPDAGAADLGQWLRVKGASR
jgi:hypothetical protein